MILKTLRTLLFLIIPLSIFGQTPVNDDCINALNLCANNTSSGTNQNASAEVLLAGNLCFAPSNGVWYSFDAVNNGSASIIISNISSTNANNEVQAALISFTNACDLSTAVIINCNAGANTNITLTGAGLIANQTYYVLIDGGETINPAAEFTFDIQDTGSAVKPTSQLTKTEATCNINNGQIKLTAIKFSDPPYTFQLNGATSQSDSTFGGLSPGNYSIVITNSSGCSFTKNVTLINLGVTSLISSSTSADCATAQNGTITISNVQPPNPNYLYSLDGGATQNNGSFTNVPAGTHFITISGINCDTTIRVNVSINGGVTSAQGQGSVINCGTTNGTINYPANSVLPVAPAGTYIYNLLGALPDQNNTGTFPNLPSGTYKIQIFNTNSPTCIYTDIVTITQLSGPLIDTTIIANEVCGDGTGQILISASLGVPPYSYSTDGSTFQQSSLITGLNKGTYIVFVKDANGCSSILPTVVSETTPGSFTDCSPGENQTIIRGEKANIDAEAPAGAVITWAPSATAGEGISSTNFKLYPLRTTVYTMTATLANGCICTKNITIIVDLPIDIPNTFTPNGDGKNDRFLIKNISSYRNVEVSIFDRWGNKVHHTTDYTDDTAWDGTANGFKVPVATYYYVIKFEFPESSGDDNPYYYQGSIALIK